MNAFGASVVLLLSAANARRHSAENAQEETRLARRCNFGVLCKKCRQRAARKRTLSGCDTLSGVE
jgi:hypothetical protein